MTVPIAPALAALAAPSGAGGFTGLLIQLAGIFALFWFIVIRPQQKQKKQHEQALRDLKKGDQIVTAGGIIAEVIHIKDAVKDGTPTPTMDDRVTIKSGESRLIVERGRIARVVARAAEASSAA